MGGNMCLANNHHADGSSRKKKGIKKKDKDKDLKMSFQTDRSHSDKYLA